MKNNILVGVFKCIFFMSIFCFSYSLMAQGGLEGQINNTINDLVRIINVLIVGFVVWSGFLIARGDQSGVTRLIYGIIGLVVVNTASLIIGYFS